jgi:hypothetical protein
MQTCLGSGEELTALALAKGAAIILRRRLRPASNIRCSGAFTCHDRRQAWRAP